MNFYIFFYDAFDLSNENNGNAVSYENDAYYIPYANLKMHRKFLIFYLKVLPSYNNCCHDDSPHDTFFLKILMKNSLYTPLLNFF